MPNNLHDDPRFGAIFFHVWPHENGRRTKTPGSHAGHRRPNTESARFVTASSDHTALGWRAADDDRLAAQIRIISLLDGRIEGVHVNETDHTEHHSQVFSIQCS